MFQDRCPCANAEKTGVWAIPGYDSRSLDWGRPMNHTYPMNLEWDETKSEACFTQRGFDFAYAARAFFDLNRIVQADTRHSYGEKRYQLT